jgi:uncharacterized protein (DUF4415 family)
MTDTNIRHASLSDIRKMKEAGKIRSNPAAPEGDSLGAEFWAKAEIVAAKKPRSVHLKLDPDVFEFFRAESHGKGHLTKMQNVLKAYAKAHG